SRSRLHLWENKTGIELGPNSLFFFEKFPVSREFGRPPRDAPRGKEIIEAAWLPNINRCVNSGCKRRCKCSQTKMDLCDRRFIGQLAEPPRRADIWTRPGCKAHSRVNQTAAAKRVP